MRRGLLAIACAAGLLLATGGSALAVSDNAGCVGQFSAFFAQGGGDTHRSIIAQDFAQNLRPAGLNVYSHIAELHGDLESCFEQT